jgi:dethiobiotin synthetase
MVCSPCLVVEGAGGLHVPVTGDKLVVDIIDCDSVIIAARAGLGTINHTLLTVESLRLRGIEPAGIIFMDNGDLTPSPDMIEENIEAVERFSGIKVFGVIGKISDFMNPPLEFLNIVGKIDRY